MSIRYLSINSQIGENDLLDAYALADQIIRYGEKHGFSDPQIEAALRACYIESKFGKTEEETFYYIPPTDNFSAGIGIYQYQYNNWKQSHTKLGTWEGNHQVAQTNNQIKAYYNDIEKFTKRYNKLTPEQRKKATLQEYLYIKHKDGPNNDDFLYDKSKAKKIWLRDYPGMTILFDTPQEATSLEPNTEAAQPERPETDVFKSLEPSPSELFRSIEDLSSRFERLNHRLEQNHASLCEACLSIEKLCGQSWESAVAPDIATLPLPAPTRIRKVLARTRDIKIEVHGGCDEQGRLTDETMRKINGALQSEIGESAQPVYEFISSKLQEKGLKA